MKRFPIRKLLPILALLMIALTACQRGATPTPDVDATVNAAIAQTAQADADMASTVAAAVAATSAAQITATPTATVAPADDASTTDSTGDTGDTGDEPAPTPSVDTYELTEEELEALIDEAVQEALAASEQAAQTTEAAAADDTLSEEEVQTIVVEVAGAEEALDEAEALINAYEEQYGPYLAEAYRTLLAMEEDLDSIAQDIATITAIIEQGADAASQATELLIEAALNAQIDAEDVYGQLFAFAEQAQQERELRQQAALAVSANAVASDRAGAVMAAQDYLNAVQNAFGDRVVSPEELAQIAQLGANASASLEGLRGPGMEALAGRIDGMTAQIAGGQWPAANADIGAIQAELDDLPGR